MKKAKLNKKRALILSLINQYRKLGYEVSSLEMQKLAYFLQRLGQKDLKLNYKKYIYGPYAHNLNHLLHELERGYIFTEKTVMDAKPLDLITINPEVLDEVDQFIDVHCSPEEKSRLALVSKIMSGFETPFGLELLASVDWIIEASKDKVPTMEDVTSGIQKWTTRKGRIFDPNHIAAAKSRLEKFNKELAYA